MTKKRSKWGINWKASISSVECPECGTTQPNLRKPKNLRQMLWGGWTCENCYCEMDKYGNKLEVKK